MPEIIKSPLSLTLFFLIVLGSCTPETVKNFAFSRKTEEQNTITALANESPDAETGSETAGSETEVSEAGLVLERGNSWTAGIPGFGENALAAFTGEYRIPGKTGLLRIWLCREFLYYDGGWTRRESISGYTVLQRSASQGLAAAAPLDSLWTAVVLFPEELSPEEEDLLFTACIERLSGFAAQQAGSRYISLPAQISF
jgi:hypothetical protein